MSLYRVTYRGDGVEVYEVEAESETEARQIVEDGEFPVDTYVEGGDFYNIEVLES